MNWNVVVLDPEALIRELRKALKDGDFCNASFIASHLSLVLRSMSDLEEKHGDSN